MVFYKEGKELWNHAERKEFWVDGIHTIPSGKKKDLPMVTSFNWFRLYGSNGEKLVEQRFGANTGLVVTAPMKTASRRPS